MTQVSPLHSRKLSKYLKTNDLSIFIRKNKRQFMCTFKYKKDTQGCESECGRSCESYSQLLVHQRSHRTRNTFDCELCSRSFFNNKALCSHMVSHNEPKVEAPSVDSGSNVMQKVNESATESQIALSDTILYPTSTTNAVESEKMPVNISSIPESS